MAKWSEAEQQSKLCAAAMNEAPLQCDTPRENESGILDVKGRNSRRPKKANHGARPCSSYMRKMKQKGWYHVTKQKE